jgi:hypothetical protein
MPIDLPIACSLSATEQSSRLAEMRAIGRAALLSANVAGRHATLRFRAGGATRERLAGIVAAEAKCCAFLEMELREDAEAIELIIDAPAGAESVLAELVDAFDGHAAAS